MGWGDLGQVTPQGPQQSRPDTTRPEPVLVTPTWTKGLCFGEEGKLTLTVAGSGVRVPWEPATRWLRCTWGSEPRPDLGHVRVCRRGPQASP